MQVQSVRFLSILSEVSKNSVIFRVSASKCAIFKHYSVEFQLLLRVTLCTSGRSVKELQLEVIK